MAPPPMQVLQFLHHLHEHLLHLLTPVSPCLSCVEEPVAAPTTAGVASPVQSGVEGLPPQTGCHCSDRSSPRSFASFAARATLLPRGQLDVHQDPKGFFAELLPMCLAPACAESCFRMPSRGCHSRFGSRTKT